MTNHDDQFDPWAPVRDATAPLTLLAALTALTAFSGGEEAAKPTRRELRTWTKLVLADYRRRALALAEKGRDLAAASREVDALRAQRDEALEERDGWLNEHATVNDALDELGRERDELKRRLVQAQRERDSLRAELARARESANARADYVLLRLRGGRPEVVGLTGWDEFDDGEITAYGHREVASSDTDM